MTSLTKALGTTGADPAEVARRVFENPDYWWKRIEKGSLPEASWLWTILSDLWEIVLVPLRAIGRLIAYLIKLLLGGLHVGGGSSGSSLVWALASTLVVLAVWKLTPLILDRLGRAAPPSRPDEVDPLVLPAAGDLRDQAAAACREGRHAEAVRLALLALIAALEKRGLLRYSTTRTNREYRAELRARPDLADHFGRLARIYERIWYGKEPAGVQQAEESIRLCAAMIDGEAAPLG